VPIDFSKLKPSSTADTLIRPREIFAALPAKKKHSWLRDVQATVLDQWYDRRTTKDLRLRMNTGSGKTLVGLLALKSSLNEKLRPAVYVAPTKYLARQVRLEAEALGLAVSDDPQSIAVAAGKAILATHVQVLLNGKSKFGVADEGVQIPIGSLVVDDVHACLATAEQQFTLELPASHPGFKKLLALFKSDLEAQSSMDFLELKSGDPRRLMLVPYWAWSSKIKEVEAALYEHRDDEAMLFPWRLLRGHLRHCRCVFSGTGLEIAPRCLPVDVVPSFARASRRIFMSATSADDSTLLTGFDANPADIAEAIVPASASDIGDRLILIAQELNPEISDDDIKALAVERAKTDNVVVLVPSSYRAGFWSDAASVQVTAVNLEEVVERLNKEHVGLAVFINKYDGIDLPHDGCRLLIIDSLPDARSRIDRVEQAMLHGSHVQVARSAQRIEQGMGRGVRANDDYCAVVLMGRSLVSSLFLQGGLASFSSATRAQLELSSQVGEQLRGKGVDEVAAAVDVFLRRDPQWVAAAKAAVAQVTYASQPAELSLAADRREAFNRMCSGHPVKAAEVLQKRINETKEPIVKGWLKAELAECVQAFDAVQSQQILSSAREMNSQLLRPQAGIEYQRLPPLSGEQAVQSLTYLRSRFSKPNEVIVAAHAVAAALEFRPDTYVEFHNAMRDMAQFIGFGAQLPEAESGAGPDVLWAVGGLRYFVIECKNGATVAMVSKHDCNQLAGSCNWFKAEYDPTCTATPVLVHPSRHFEHAATPPSGTRVITRERLAELREAFVAFAVGVSKLAGFGQPKEVALLLAQHGLLADVIATKYSEEAKKK